MKVPHLVADGILEIMLKDSSVWTEGLVRTLVRGKLMLMARCHENGSISAKYMISSRGRSIVYGKEMAPGTSEYEAVQAVLGPMRPCQLITFDLPDVKELVEYSPEDVRVSILRGYFKKAELLNDGDVRLYHWNDFLDDWSHQLFPSNSKQAQAILEITGPLKVGEVYEFKPSSD